MQLHPNILFSTITCPKPYVPPGPPPPPDGADDNDRDATNLGN